MKLLVRIDHPFKPLSTITVSPMILEKAVTMIRPRIDLQGGTHTAELVYRETDGDIGGAVVVACDHSRLSALLVAEPELLVTTRSNPVLVQAPRSAIRLILPDDTHLIPQGEWAFAARPTRGRNQQDISKRTLRRDPFEIAHHV